MGYGMDEMNDGFGDEWLAEQHARDYDLQKRSEEESLNRKVDARVKRILKTQGIAIDPTKPVTSLPVRKLLTDIHKIDADVGLRQNNTIIMTGHFRGRGYVNFYDLGDAQFGNLVNQLTDMSKVGAIRNIDHVHGYSSMLTEKLQESGAIDRPYKKSKGII